MLVVKNLPASAGDIRDVGSIPGLERCPGGGHGNPFHYIAWRSPWTQEPGGLQSIGSHRVGHDCSNLAQHTILSLTLILYFLSFFFFFFNSVGQSCLALWDPIHYSPPGSSVHGISHAEILEWVAISFSRGSSRLLLRDYFEYWNNI